ncbi:MAG TPA: septal ring lytic transglycosylase RlpA family protein [Terricaulis sp.]|nr:septal ring lytic transglycosylase RlpA family protein [Terricaulis sp.]
MRFAVTFTALFAAAGAAAAQAPITFAGQGAPAPHVQTAALPDRLAGADDNSYGYGQIQARQQDGVIDLRRSAGQTAPQTAAAEPAPAQAGAQPWLERERVGPPYQANGRWYVPTPEPGYEQVGEGSWYGPNFHGLRTANGEVYDQEGLTAAHPTLPLNSLVQVTNLENGREIIVRINDRGPFVGERLIDLTRAGAEILGFERAGHARVHVRYLGPAPRRVNADGVSAPAPASQPAQADDLAGGPMSLVPERTEPAPQWPQPEVQTIAYAPRAGAYVVQVGAFSDPVNAQRVRGAVEAAGPVDIDVRRNGAGVELFRVRVGPYATPAEAEDARRMLAGMGYPDAVVAQR